MSHDILPIRPPLGLKPRWVHNEQRLREVNEAIQRYRAANKEVPKVWYKEHSLLTVQFVKHHLRQARIRSERKTLSSPTGQTRLTH